MKISLLIIALVLVFAGFVEISYATIEITPFDLNITSKDFFETTPNYYPYLIMNPSNSRQITIDITNNDSKQQTINLFMAKETPRPDRNFVFEPSQLQLESGETGTSILTVSASPDANTGLTVLHTMIAQSTSFGAKSFAFYVEITEQITPPSPDPVRVGPDGMMFSKNARFDLSESDAFELIPFDVSPPNLSDGFSFQVMDGSRDEPRLFYSKEPLSENTLYSEFSDGEDLLITFEKEEYFTYDEYLQFLNPNEQQVRINGKNGISASVEIKTEDDSYTESRVTAFLDDVKLQLESKMPDEQLLQIAESMIKDEKPIQELTSIPNAEHAEMSGMSWISYGHQWIMTIIFIISVLIAISAGIILGVKVWRKRKRK